MDSYTLQKWKRVESMAVDLKVTIELTDTIRLKDEHQLMLGCFDTVNETYSFLCGYDHKPKI